MAEYDQLTQAKHMVARLDPDPDNTCTAIARVLAGSLQVLMFPSASHVYNPLTYMWEAHREYLQRYGSRNNRILLLGMNPGPWGMAQTGVPFGEVSAARDWLKIEKPLGGPLPDQHQKYPIAGFACHRSEGSGDRFWGWARQRFGSPEQFFQDIFVWNYCPLLFLRNNRNLIPEQLHKAEREPLFGICDAALSAVVHAINPRVVVGIGRFAHGRAQIITAHNTPTAYLLHPSPANPTANQGWADIADETLAPWL
ncbi:uracil-DNA glycosylase family protein [Pollutimonas sp. M17]|uniref:uracil-DNA glycosylase family protein n=1 Tax=Pollutimonas sp. M17 TaxID=2962065 RepID=UPI0021F3E63B|nr:uracil-DNA glycosylase family protein [Pollutimonas sp. M17]UYO94169.1 single-stranded DNA-binding protein [Pollutimonas sp. M17]